MSLRGFKMFRSLIFAALTALSGPCLFAQDDGSLHYYIERETFAEQFDRQVRNLQNNFTFWSVPDQTVLWKFKNYGALKFVDGKIILGDERRVDYIEPDGQNLLINQNIQTKLAIEPLLQDIARQVARKYAK